MDNGESLQRIRILYVMQWLQKELEDHSHKDKLESGESSVDLGVMKIERRLCQTLTDLSRRNGGKIVLLPEEPMTRATVIK